MTARTIDLMKSLPIVCELDAAAQREREATIRRLLGRAAVEVTQLPDGVAVRLPGDAEHLQRITELMALERACCRFLRFELTAEPAQGLLLLRITGPAGTPAFVRSWFEPGAGDHVPTAPE